MVTVVVSGGRHFEDYAYLSAKLDEFNSEHGITLLVQGEARGADRLAKQWAAYRGISCVGEPANWKRYQGTAGPIRNIAMLARYRPDYVITFPGGSGTRHMKTEARSRGFNVIEY